MIKGILQFLILVVLLMILRHLEAIEHAVWVIR